MKNRWNHNNYIIDSYQEISSTNDVLLNLAMNHQVNHNHVILADKQSNGHGRYSRKWVSDIGNLYFSLLIRSPENSSLLSFVSIISLSKTISELFPTLEGSICHKWPNDFLINKKKAAGILLKNDIKTNSIVIGLGLNLKSHPLEVNFEATNLESELGKAIQISKEGILKKFLDNFALYYKKLLDFGFSPIRNLWLEKAYRINQDIKTNLTSQKIQGSFQGIDSSGNLILKEENGNNKIISSLEIFN